MWRGEKGSGTRLGEAFPGMFLALWIQEKPPETVGFGDENCSHSRAGKGGSPREFLDPHPAPAAAALSGTGIGDSPPPTLETLDWLFQSWKTFLSDSSQEGKKSNGKISQASERGNTKSFSWDFRGGKKKKTLELFPVLSHPLPPFPQEGAAAPWN